MYTARRRLYRKTKIVFKRVSISNTGTYHTTLVCVCVYIFVFIFNTFIRKKTNAIPSHYSTELLLDDAYGTGIEFRTFPATLRGKRRRVRFARIILRPVPYRPYFLCVTFSSGTPNATCGSRATKRIVLFSYVLLASRVFAVFGHRLYAFGGKFINDSRGRWKMIPAKNDRYAEHRRISSWRCLYKSNVSSLPAVHPAPYFFGEITIFTRPFPFVIVRYEYFHISVRRASARHGVTRKNVTRLLVPEVRKRILITVALGRFGCLRPILL